jgi:predicted HTH transcriptional regulator
MTASDLIDLLHDLCSQPQEQQWLEFKLNGADHEQIGEYISAMSNGATLANKPFGYLVWGVEDGSHKIKGTTFTFVNARHGNQDLELWLRTYLEPKFLSLIMKANISSCCGFLRQRASRLIFNGNHSSV